MAKVGSLEGASYNRRRHDSRAHYLGGLEILYGWGWRRYALAIAWIRAILFRDAICYAIAGALALFLGTCFWWLAFDRDPPVVLISGSVEPNPVAPGATVRIHMQFKEYRVCPGEIERRIIDQSGEVHTYVGTNAVYINETPADQVTIDREFQSPSSIHPGTWYYAPTVKWYCNPAQRWFNLPIVITQKAIPFEVQGVPPALQQQLDNKVQKHLENIPLPRERPNSTRVAAKLSN